MKTFKEGQAVEVRRAPEAKWEPAKYLRRAWRGWHGVELPETAARRIDTMSGMECDSDNPRGVLTRFLIVPTQRLRAKEGNPS